MKESCCFIKSKIQIRCSQCRGAFWVIAYKRASAYWLSIHDIGRPARLHSSQRDVFKRPVKVSTGRGFFLEANICFVLNGIGIVEAVVLPSPPDPRADWKRPRARMGRTGPASHSSASPSAWLHNIL